MIDPTLELQVAIDAARAGGEVLSRYFREGVTKRMKGACDFVTDADVESEQVIVNYLREKFPDHAVMGEEEHRADVHAEQLWIVDPLDGTTNFAHGIPHFAVSIAYVERGVPMAGVVYNPSRDDWYTVARGRGAFANDKQTHVSDHRQLSDVIMGVGFYYDRGAMMRDTLQAIDKLFQQQIHGIRRFGTAAIDLCMVGMGQFGGFFEYELSPWDFAAGALFVEEAGGRVTTCDNQPLPLAKSSLLASNGHLHESVLNIVRRS
jgi:myo-inositol-1(or 4)-monophosphatase